MAISPAAAAAAGAKKFAKSLANTNLSMGVPPGAPITQTVQKAAENTQELGKTKETLTETQNNLNKANTNLNNANKLISNLQGQVEELKKNGGSFVKIDTYIPHKDSYKSVTDITVSGAGAFGSEEDGDYTDYSSANGVYRVTPETAENENPFERVYKHETADWYIHGYFDEEYGEGYWYIGTSPDNERLGLSVSENAQIQSGTYTFSDWDYGWEVEVTLAVNEVDVPEQPLVLTGRKSTGFDPDTWEFTWSDESESFLECSETPEPGMIFTASGNQLLFGHLYSSDESKCYFHHSFSAPSEVADSGQTFVFGDYRYNTYRPKFTVVDRVRCAYSEETGDYSYITAELTDFPADMFSDKAYVLTTYSYNPPRENLLPQPLRFASITSVNSITWGNAETGLMGYDGRVQTYYNQRSAWDSKPLREMGLAGIWCQWVCNIHNGKVELWANGELLNTSPMPNREDRLHKAIRVGRFYSGEPTYLSKCYCYGGRSLTGQEIKLMWEKFQKEQDEFAPVNMPSVDDNTVLAISLNEGLLKDYSDYAHALTLSSVSVSAHSSSTSSQFVSGRTEGEAGFKFGKYRYISVTPKDSELTLRGNWTIEFDIYLPDGLPEQRNRNFIGFSNGQGLAIAYGCVGEGFCISESGDSWKIISGKVEAKTWTHVKITRNGTTVSCSLDGVSSGLTADITSEAFASVDLPLCIGTARQTNAQYQFGGYFNNLVISNVAR